MAEEKNQPVDEQEEQKQAEEELPFCTTAPSAEQARAADEDEPCDDARGAE